MKKVISLLFFISILFGCTNKNKLEPNVSKKGIWHSPSYTRIRSSNTSLSSDRYLGKTFNLIDFEYNDEAGFCQYQVLDLNQSPWSPFSSTIISDIRPEIITEDYHNQEINREYHLKIDEKTLTDSMSFSPSISYKKCTLTYTKASSNTSITKSNRYSSYLYQIQKTVSFDTEYPEDFECFLSRKFIRDLNRLSSEELVTKYGTHIVLSYKLGAYMNLVISTNSEAFTNEETQRIELKIWDNLVNLPIETRNKIKKNASDVSIVYKQGGSDYQPSEAILNVSSLYSENPKINSLSEKEWKEGIRKNDNTFLSINKNGTGVIAIPDLISNVPLKIKYLSGILYNSLLKGKSYGITYILCSPKNYEPVLYNGKHLNINLRNYTDKQVVIYQGLGSSKLLTESILENTGSEYNDWNASINPNGLWTFKNRLTNKYLCVDLKVRDESDDSENMRYWLINPIVPNKNGNLININNLFIKK